MPKVNPGHAEKKKAEILEAAKRVCSSKPIYDVAMRDIVIESSMSQGGVYKYFSNIDDIFVAILNQESLTSQMKENIDNLFKSQLHPLEKLEQFLQYIGQHIGLSIMRDGSIYYELASLYSRDPERFENVKSRLEEVSNLQYLQEKFTLFLLEQLDNGSFKTAMPKEEVMTLIETYMAGVVNHPDLSYKSPEELTGKISRQIRVLATALKEILTGDEYERIQP